MTNKYKITEIFCIIDEFNKNFNAYLIKIYFDLIVS